MIKAIVAIVLATLSLSGYRPADPACCAPRPVVLYTRIMPMGDSITLGLSSSTGTGYRGYLDQLTCGKFTWVGSLGQPPLMHEGHSGWTIDQLAVNARDWVQASHPAIVLLDAGTNDDGHNQTSIQMLASMGHLLDEIYAGGASIVVVAQITITPYNNTWQQQQEKDFNAGLPALAATKGHTKVVDMTGVHISSDRVHPDDAGYLTMAQVWRTVLPPSC